jgi:hypothetical protein
MRLFARSNEEKSAPNLADKEPRCISPEEPRITLIRGSFVGWCGNTQSYSENAKVYRNLSWDVQYGAYQAPVQVAGVALVLRFGPEPRDAAALVVGVEGQVQADGVVDAADETHAGSDLLAK